VLPKKEKFSISPSLNYHTIYSTYAAAGLFHLLIAPRKMRAEPFIYFFSLQFPRV
jgi:hypothetical protein